MSSRREFTANVQLEIKTRAKDSAGVMRCEKCAGVAIGGEIHHVDQDAMQIDKSRKLTVADGLFLCKPCHKEITKAQAPVLAHIKRVERRHNGVHVTPAQKMKSAPMPTTERAAARRSREPRAALPPRQIYEEA